MLMGLVEKGEEMRVFLTVSSNIGGRVPELFCDLEGGSKGFFSIRDFDISRHQHQVPKHANSTDYH
jgi:hypothetical protein